MHITIYIRKFILNKIGKRMKYLHELNVPLRQRITYKPISWKTMYLSNSSLRFEIKYFYDDETLQFLCDKYEN